MSCEKTINSKDILRNILNLKQLTFEVTDNCNLKCKYCGYGELYSWYDVREAKNMSFDDIKLLLDHIIELWRMYEVDNSSYQTYISFYGGEPLMNTAFIKEVIGYIRDNNVKRGIKYSMTTNAVLLDKHMDFLVENDFHLLISLDGNKEANSYRTCKNGAESYQIIIRNIKSLQAKYPEFFVRRVNFNSVLHNRNSVETILEYFKSEFDKVPSIAELNSSGISEEARAEFEAMYNNKQQNIKQSSRCDELETSLMMSDPQIRSLYLFLRQYSGNVFNSYSEFFIDKNVLPIIPTGTCTPFSKKMFVTVSGKILQCEKINHKYYCGKVCADKLSLDLGQIANNFNELVGKRKSLCSACYKRRNCSQCVFYLDENYTKCPGFSNKSGFEEYAASCMTSLHYAPHLYETLITKVKLI